MVVGARSRSIRETHGSHHGRHHAHTRRVKEARFRENFVEPAFDMSLGIEHPHFLMREVSEWGLSAVHVWTNLCGTRCRMCRMCRMYGVWGARILWLSSAGPLGQTCSADLAPGSSLQVTPWWGQCQILFKRTLKEQWRKRGMLITQVRSTCWHISGSGSGSRIILGWGRVSATSRAGAVRCVLWRLARCTLRKALM